MHSYSNAYINRAVLACLMMINVLDLVHAMRVCFSQHKSKKIVELCAAIRALAVPISTACGIPPSDNASFLFWCVRAIIWFRLGLQTIRGLSTLCDPRPTKGVCVPHVRPPSLHINLTARPGRAMDEQRWGKGPTLGCWGF